jgi:hypothetical protein
MPVSFYSDLGVNVSGGGRGIYICTRLGKLCVYCVVSAEYAMCAHETVLAWVGKSYFGAIYTSTVLSFNSASVTIRS